MTLQGVDYSGSGPLTAAQCHANGLSFVCRYVSNTNTKWNIAKTVRQSEVDDFLAGGIGVVIVFESDVSDALGGYAQGVTNARLADAKVTALGIPGCPVYFAVDFDAQPSQFATVADYLDGAASVIGHDRVGAYGGYYPIRWLLDRGLRYAWQAIAWSNGHIDPRAHIFQDSGGTVAGVDVDWDRTICSDTDYGQVGARPTEPAEWSAIHWILSPV